MINITELIIAVAAYFVGAIPVGYIIARLKGIHDIRQHGSGNIGATNVSRLFGLHYFFLIFLLDAGKAFLFMYFIKPHFFVEYLYFFASILLFGNSCSLFLRGSGGKGVSTLFGALCALNMPAVVFLLCVWCVSMLIIKTVGLASIIAVCSFPVYACLMHDHALCLFSCVVAFWIVWLHRSNIRAYWEKCCSKK